MKEKIVLKPTNTDYLFKFSIVTAVYNVEPYLSEAIDSILSQVTPQTRLVSSIRLQVLTRKNATKKERNTSPLHPVVVQDVHFIQTTWQQVLLPTV